MVPGLFLTIIFFPSQDKKEGKSCQSDGSLEGPDVTKIVFHYLCYNPSHNSHDAISDG